MSEEIFKIVIDGSSSLQLQKQVYKQLRELILTGTLEPGFRLPPTRVLADTLQVSRKTVVKAYDQLLAEGYVTSQTGSGTFVSPNLPGSNDFDDRPDHEIDTPPFTSLKNEPIDSKLFERLSAYGKRALSTNLLPPRMEQARFPFFSWQPAFEEIPLTEWARIVSKTFRRPDPRLIDYAADPLGHLPLRQALAERLRKTRGLECDPGQVIITCGLSQSLDLIAKLHVDEDSNVLVENPCYWPARDLFRSYGAHVRSINVDHGGMKTGSLSRLARHNFSAVYITPSHQYPTGTVLTLARRLELLNWAGVSGAIVIEDDFDSEFRYRGSPIPALKSLDKDEQVIYLSTFTKVLYPSIALAYMVVPRRLVPLYARARWLNSDQMSLQLQESLAEFIASNQLERHVKRMRQLYAQRRRALVDAVQTHLAGNATIYGDPAGLSVLLRVRSELPDDEIMSRARARGIALLSTRPCYTRNSVPGEFILGYGNLSTTAITDGIIELGDVIRGTI